MSDHTKHIGKRGTFNIPLKGAEPCGFIVPIRVLDTRVVCNRVDVKVEPVGGEGAAWLKLANVKLEE